MGVGRRHAVPRHLGVSGITPVSQNTRYTIIHSPTNYSKAQTQHQTSSRFSVSYWNLQSSTLMIKFLKSFFLKSSSDGRKFSCNFVTNQSNEANLDL